MDANTPQAATPRAPLYVELARNTSDRAEAELSVEGEIPATLSGVLYRNGPGIFLRGDLTKEMILDGDGIIQRLEFHSGHARYSRRFVRTPKFIAEAAANCFLWSSWTTALPGARKEAQQVLSQAGITTYLVNETLYALDEVAPGFEVDADTLETRRAAKLGLPEEDRSMRAHARYLVERGDWLFASTRMNPHGMSIDLVRHRANGERIVTPTITAPRMSYLHDFGATDRYAIMILQPAIFDPSRYMSGLATFLGSIEWRPSEGNVVLLVDLATDKTQRFEAPASWVWHIGNAFEQNEEVIIDFAGYDDPGHFLGHGAQLAAVMRGEDGVRGAAGHLRRYTITPHSGRLAQTIMSDGNFEFPSSDPRFCGIPHRRLYATRGLQPGMLHSAIAALDTKTGQLDSFDFGLHVNVLEPIFAPQREGKPEEGWLITQTLDTKRGTSGFAILDASNVSAGPVATVQLGETMPISFHGQWVAR